MNKLDGFQQLATALASYDLPVRVGFEATGTYHRPLPHHLGRAGFGLVHVVDSGQGIPEDVRNRVFDRFLRVHDDASGGCGLGPAIDRQVAKVHGGSTRIVVRTEGSEVQFRIPTGKV